MPVPSYAWIAIAAASAMASPCAAQTGYADLPGGARVIALPGAAPGQGARLDRTVVSPFEGDRRVVVRPDGLPEPAPSAAQPAAAQPAAAQPPLATAASGTARGSYVSIGSIDDPSPPAGGPALPPCVGDCPADDAPYVDIGPYDDAMSLSPFPPE